MDLLWECDTCSKVFTRNNLRWKFGCLDCGEGEVDESFECVSCGEMFHEDFSGIECGCGGLLDLKLEEEEDAAVRVVDDVCVCCVVSGAT